MTTNLLLLSEDVTLAGRLTDGSTGPAIAHDHLLRVGTVGELGEAVRHDVFDAIVIDARLDSVDALALLAEVRLQCGDSAILVIDTDDLWTAKAMLSMGVQDVLQPCDGA